MQKTLRLLLAGTLLIGAGLSSGRAAAPPTAQGLITMRIYRGISGTAVSDLTNNAAFPDNPSSVLYMPYFEAWAGGDITTPAASSVEDNYGTQMVGYFYPQTTGDFIFYISADDNASLYLSTDDTPANKKLIAAETVWSNPREYQTSGGASSLTAKDSSQYTGTQWPTKDTVNGGAKITLTAGKAYYIEALEKEGGGGDNLSVSIDASTPIAGTMLSTIDKTTGPVSITTQPQGATVAENQSATFSVAVNGTPPYTYQWTLNGTDIQDATNATLVISRVPAADNAGKLTVTVTGAQGSPATSTAANITVTPDTTAPTVVSAKGSSSFKGASVTFSEPVDPATATNAANYTISGLTVSGASLRAVPNDNVVDLITSAQTQGQSYTVGVKNVKDISAAGTAVAANSSVSFTAFALLPGVAQKYFDNFTGAVEDLLTDARYPDSPNLEFSSSEPAFEFPPNAANEAGSNYGNELAGWVTAPVTGDYIFFLCSDDHSELFLSTDDTPANKHLIAAETVWSNPRQWLTSAGASDLTQKRSDQNPSTTWPTLDPTAGGAKITLTAGKKYYIQALHQEGGGGDNVSVTWQIPGGKTVADNDPPISALDVSGYVDPSLAPKLTVTTPPANVTVQEGRSATLTANISVPTNSPAVYYRWQSAPSGSSTFANIIAATGSTFKTPALALADSGSKYQLVAASVGTNLITPAATVTVVPDTFPPVATAGALSNQSNTIDVGVAFDEPIDAAGNIQANYSISAGTITGFKAYTNSPGAVLTVSGLTAGNNYTVTVKNISDLKGNKLTSTNVSFTIGKMSWGVVGADQLKLGNGVVPVGTDGFDVYSDAFGEWNNYDESTFVYEQITGDFDKKVRVEYQDLSSEWARAGLVVREVTNFGVDAATQTGDPSGTVSNATGTPPYTGKAGRYQKIHVNPVGPTLTGPGTAGNASWEGNRRLDVGGPSSTALTGANSLPKYPNAWCRLQRTGQTFTIYRSDDGVTWVNLGSTTWPDAADPSSTPFPATLYVGPEFSPENGNITDTTSYGVWLAKFREYGDTAGGGGGGGGNAPTLALARTATGLTLTYTGTLQSADAISGPWTDVAGTSPANVTTSGSAKFYRAKQ